MEAASQGRYTMGAMSASGRRSLTHCDTAFNAASSSPSLSKDGSSWCSSHSRLRHASGSVSASFSAREMASWLAVRESQSRCTWSSEAARRSSEATRIGTFVFGSNRASSRRNLTASSNTPTWSSKRPTCSWRDPMFSSVSAIVAGSVVGRVARRTRHLSSSSCVPQGYRRLISR